MSSAAAVRRSTSLNTGMSTGMSAAVGGKSAVRGQDVNSNRLDDRVMLALTVVLPDRMVKVINVDSSTPMMDLLVQVCSDCKLKPGEHHISVVSEETGRTVDYQSSQSIGSLDVSRIFLLSKAMQKKQREKEIQRNKDISKFEQTIRVTVNLPRGVKSLQRLNPSLPLLDIYRRVCLEKGLDPSRYEVRLTKQPYITVDMSLSLTDYQTSEITVVPCSVPDFHTSMVDISRVNQMDSRSKSAAAPTAGGSGSSGGGKPKAAEKIKKKGGIFSFLRRDKKSASQKDLTRSDDDGMPKAWQRLEENRAVSLQNLSKNGDMPGVTRKPQAQVKPQPKVQATIAEETDEELLRNKAKRAQSKKKYRAPAPPARPLSTLVTIEESKKSAMFSSTPNLQPELNTNSLPRSRRTPVKVNHHSRNSSDSSGYHEAPTTLPSPVPPSKADSIRPIEPDVTITATSEKPVALVHRSQTLPPGSSIPPSNNRKAKKKAPAPPMASPTAAQPLTPSIKQSGTPLAQLLQNSRIVESEDETNSLSSHDGIVPERGLTASAPVVVQPPIFIPPPPPASPPPPAVSESVKRESYQSYESESPDKEISKLTLSPPQAQHSRSESRCSRASINTIDDVQLHFDIAIAAGEQQLESEVAPSTNGEISRLTADIKSLTERSTAKADVQTKEDSSSDGSLIPDGDQYVEVSPWKPSATKTEDNLDSVQSTRSIPSYTGNVKPVEEITYGSDNPFRGIVPPVRFEEGEKLDMEPLVGKRRDSQISDSTLPDSEHTDRLQSSSLQSSTLQSDNEEESITETGDGYETAGTDKISQSEADLVSPEDATLSPSQFVPKTGQRGMFVELKGNDVNTVIYGDKMPGSVRGVPGQDDGDSSDSEVKDRASSFDSDEVAGDKPRPKSIFNILTSNKVTSEAPKRKAVPTSLALQQNSSPAESEPSSAFGDSNMHSLYSKPLPIYSRMNKPSPATSGNISSKNTTTPTESKPLAVTPTESKPLAAVLSDSMKSGEANKSMKKVPESPSGKPIFFKSGRSNSQIEITQQPPSRVANVVKLESKYEPKSISVKPSTVEKSSNQKTAASANVTRKESFKDQTAKLQESMAKWQQRLKDNEMIVRELTTSDPKSPVSTAGGAITSTIVDTRSKAGTVRSTPTRTSPTRTSPTRTSAVKTSPTKTTPVSTGPPTVSTAVGPTTTTIVDTRNRTSSRTSPTRISPTRTSPTRSTPAISSSTTVSITGAPTTTTIIDTRNRTGSRTSPTRTGSVSINSTTANTTNTAPSNTSKAQDGRINLPRSVSTSEKFSSKNFTSNDKNRVKSEPEKLHQVTLKSAAHRVIQKKEPELDPVETLMKSIRDRSGRTSDYAPDRGIYVADGENKHVATSIATREIAPNTLPKPGKSSAPPTVCAKPAGIPPPPPPPLVSKPASNAISEPVRRTSKPKSQDRGSSKTSDPRFSQQPSPRESLLAEIAKAKGKPDSRNSRRRAIDSSSSQSSSDELKEIERRQRPHRPNKLKSKRSISDPFPPQPNSKHSIQPTPTQLDPREELMIAIRNSGGLSRLNKVKTNEVKWSAQV